MYVVVVFYATNSITGIVLANPVMAISSGLLLYNSLQTYLAEYSCM